MGRACRQPSVGPWRTFARVTLRQLRPALLELLGALEELQEDALLPHPVKLRDMILRHQLGVEDAKSINHDFQDYLARFGESQKIARGILEKLASSNRKQQA